MSPTHYSLLASRYSSGFTLIEAAVGLLLMAVTFGILWSLFFFDNKRITVSMERLTALRGGEGIVENLRNDLKNMVPPLSAEYAAWGNVPLLLEAAGASADAGSGYDKLTFYRHVRSADPSSPLVKIVYRLDPASRRVMRSADGKESAIGGTPVRDFLLFFRREGASEYLTYEIVTTFQGVTGIFSSKVNIQEMRFQGQIDLVDKVAAAERTRWVPTAADSR
ncbi:MAG: hypothetical protein HYY25_15870 [Candidatus Wallbacteria bacterium]|nr:hypothetical protein [Candidatus Wallbacteria bacterium]